MGCYGQDWINLAYDRDQWRYLMNTVVNIRVLQNFGNFLLAAQPGGCSESDRFLEVG
jgi:hypothetical protein